jgi:hypothetical protein
MDCGIALTLLLIVNFGALLFGWLADVRRYGWEGHRGWRLGLALFTVLLVGLGMVKSLDAIRLPSDGSLVNEAVAAFEKGRPIYLLAALEYGVAGATEACRPYLESGDLAERFFAAIALWRWNGRAPEMAERASREMRELRRRCEAEGGIKAFPSGFHERIAGGLAAQLGSAAALPFLDDSDLDREFWWRWEQREARYFGNPADTRSPR